MSNNYTNSDNQPNQTPNRRQRQAKKPDSRTDEAGYQKLPHELRPFAGRAQRDPLHYDAHPYPSMLRGARVVVITNSLVSTDRLPVHAGYQRYRKPLLEAGVELYEIKPAASDRRARRAGGGFFGPRGAGGSSGASLHARTFAFDRWIGFVGSYNLDPRSSRLNTEMRVLFDCPELVKQLPETLEPDMDRNMYRLELAGGRIVWVTREDGKEVRYTSEPQAGFSKRAKVRVLGWLPIEWML